MARSKRLAAQQLVKIMRPGRMVFVFGILQYAEMLANWVNGSFGTELLGFDEEWLWSKMAIVGTGIKGSRHRGISMQIDETGLI